MSSENHDKENLRLLIDNIADYAIYLLDPTGMIISWNVGAENLQGYSAAEIIGQHFSIFYTDHEKAIQPARVLNVAVSQGRCEDEGWRIRKDGKNFWANDVITVIFGPENSIRGFTMITRDLTATRQAIEALRQSEERAQLMIAAVQDYAIFMLSPEGIIQTWNLGAERLKGYKPHEIIGKHFSIFYSEDEKLVKPPQELEIAKKAGRYEEEGWRIRKDGTRMWANVVITALFGPDGKLRGFSKVTRDLTVKKQNEEALRQSEERAQLMIAAVQDYAIFMLSPEGIVQTWNLGAQRLKGYKPSEIIGKHFSIFYSDEEKSIKPPMELEIAAKEGRYEEEGWRIRKDGTRMWANVVITTLYGTDGNLRGFCKVTRDLTAKRQAEEARMKLEQERIARAEAERANRVKDEFLAIVSHELRTPLMPIVGWSKMLQDERINSMDKARGLKTIERNALAQAKLIEDLLDISAIVSGKIQLSRKPVGLAQVIEAGIDSVREQARSKKIKLSFVLEESVGPINADALRLQQIIWNLLSNAVKFTEENGVIEVRVRRTDNFATMVIKDNGVGIAADYLPHIFERFSQYNSSSTRRHGGLGIGLFVVYQLVTLHGGRIRAESSGIGTGTEFIVDLPIPDKKIGESAYPIDVVDVTENTALIGKRVLVVDDEEDARDFLAFAVRQCGADVLVAQSVKEALQIMQSSKVDLLVSDIGMPGEDGYQLIRAIRSTGSVLPAIAVTAFARGEDAVRATDAGFHRHLAKPVNPTELCATVASLIKGS